MDPRLAEAMLNSQAQQNHTHQQIVFQAMTAAMAAQAQLPPHGLQPAPQQAPSRDDSITIQGSQSQDDVLREYEQAQRQVLEDGPGNRETRLLAEDEDEEQDLEEPPMKRGRGRPRKVSNLESEDPEQHAGLDQHDATHPGPITRSAATVDNTTPNPETPLTQKRGPGRPKGSGSAVPYLKWTEPMSTDFHHYFWARGMIRPTGARSHALMREFAARWGIEDVGKVKSKISNYFTTQLSAEERGRANSLWEGKFKRMVGVEGEEGEMSTPGGVGVGGGGGGVLTPGGTRIDETGPIPTFRPTGRPLGGPGSPTTPGPGTYAIQRFDSSRTESVDGAGEETLEGMLARARAKFDEGMMLIREVSARLDKRRREESVERNMNMEIGQAMEHHQQQQQQQQQQLQEVEQVQEEQ
ncbi:hypothetical protein YB2330_004022 [Saitoella coloradoensis]